MATTTRYFARKGLLAKIETTPGTDAVPTSAANAIEARNVQFTPLDASYVENAVEVPYYGNQPELLTAQACKLSFDVAFQGPGTAGSAHGAGPLLRAAGMSETLLAAAATGTATAGSTNTITLAAGASAVDNAYQGMFIALTGGTGAGQSGYILSYVGATKVATMVDTWTTPPSGTTTYSIGAQSVYRPVSSAFEAATLYMYLDGILHKLLFTRGSVKGKLTPKALPLLSFDMLALYTTPTDTALPATLNLAAFKQPNPVMNAWTTAATVHGFTTNMYDFSFDLGQKSLHRDDVVGIDDVLITERAPSGNIVVQAGLMADKDWYTEAKNAVLGSLNVTHGNATGYRGRICLPATTVKAPKLENKNGVVGLGMDLRPCTVNGNDELFMVFD